VGDYYYITPGTHQGVVRAVATAPFPGPTL